MPYADPSVARQKRKEKYWRNPEAARAAARTWGSKNRDRQRAKSSAYRAANHDAILAAKREWSRTRTQEDRVAERAAAVARDPKLFWLRRQLISVRYRARKRGIPFELTLQDLQAIDLPDVCPYLGTPLSYVGSGHHGPGPESPSLDRIDPTRGYVVGNVEVISNRANALKGDGSPEEHQRIADRLRFLRTKDST